MKKLLFLFFVTVLAVVVSGIVIGADDKPAKSESAGGERIRVRPRDMRARRAEGGGADRKTDGKRGREMMVERKIKQITANLERNAKANKAFVAQLEEIKKVAKKEKAKKTVAKTQEYIDKYTKELNEQKAAVQKEIEAFKNRMEEVPQPGTKPERVGSHRRDYRRGQKRPVDEGQKAEDKDGEKNVKIKD